MEKKRKHDNKYLFLDYLLLRNKPLFTRIFVLFSFLIITLVSIIIITSSKIYLEHFEKQAYDYSYSALKSKSETIDVKLRQYDIVSLQIFSNSQIREILADEEANRYNKVLNQKIFNEVISSLTSKEYLNDAVSIYVGTDYDYYYTGHLRTNYEQYYKTNYEKLKKTKGGMEIFETEEVQGISSGFKYKCFAVGRLINNENLQSIGFLAIDIREDFFEDVFKDFCTSNSSSIYVFEKGGGEMYSFDTQAISSKYIENTFSTDKYKKPYTIDSIDGGKYLISTFSSGYSDFGYVYLVPLDHISASITEVTRAVIILYLIFTFLIILVSISISKDISRPIKKLVDTMHQIHKGELTKRASVYKGAETRELATQFNKMLDRISELMQQNIEKERKINKTELAMLQAQINPHFLYNTLNSIRWISIINKQNQIKKLIESLSILIMHTFRSEKQIIALEEELSVLSHYITIMKVRYKMFSVKYEIEPSTENLAVLRFILQPFVENCIIHAFKDIDYIGEVVILSKKTGKCLLLMIDDNGLGFGKDDFESVIQKRGKDASFSKIGINNIHQRLQLHYGKDYGVFAKKNDKGTRIIIKLPIMPLDDGPKERRIK